MKNPNNVVFIRVNHDLIKINLLDVFLIEAVSNYTLVHCGSKKYTLANTIAWFMKRLPEKDFARIHRTFAVRVDKIDAIKGTNCIINNKKIPIARRSRRKLIDRLVII